MNLHEAQRQLNNQAMKIIRGILLGKMEDSVFIPPNLYT